MGVAGRRGRGVGGAEGGGGRAVGVLGSSVLRRVRVVPRQRGRRPGRQFNNFIIL